MNDDDDEAALLAELRAISSQSASSSRFDTNDSNSNHASSPPPPPTTTTTTTVNPSSPAAPATPTSSLPPWKRGRASRLSVSPRTPKIGGNSYSNNNSPGGANTSSLPSPFMSPFMSNTTTPTTTPGQRTDDEPRPQQPTASFSFVSADADDALHVSSFERPLETIHTAESEDSFHTCATSKTVSARKQEQQQRGGGEGDNAEDAELLALLRGVSAKSSSASRFDDDEDDDADAAALAEILDPPTTEKKLSPWKRTLLNNSHEKQQKQQQATTPSPNNANEGGGDDDDDDGNNNGADKTHDVPLAATPPPTQNIAASATEAVSDSANNQQIILPMEPASDGFKSDIPSTFIGERGGDAEDVELLALLRGVSAKSGASRFDDGGDEIGADNIHDVVIAKAPTPVPDPMPSPKQPKASRESDQLPPWKRRGTNSRNKQQAIVDVVVVAAPTKAAAPSQNITAAPEAVSDSANQLEPASYGIKSDIPSTFSGERGGDAEDAELLALLRGVSAKSGASRFDDGGDDNGVHDVVSTKAPTPVPDPVPSPKQTKASSGSEQLPPWKQAIDVVAAAPARVEPKCQENTAAPEASDSANQASTEASYGIKSEIPSTFSGERGGSAEDAELLALLRGVSAKSGTSRFDDGGDDDNNNGADKTQDLPILITPAAQITDTVPSPKQTKASRECDQLPPWKQRGVNSRKKQQAIVDVVVAAPAKAAAPSQNITAAPDAVSDSANQLEPASYGIKSDIPSTFTGERGGDAEDAELLALLRGVSAKSGASRFDEGGDDNGVHDVVITKAPTPVPDPVPSPKQTKASSESDQLPPWKRRGSNSRNKLQTIDVVAAAPARVAPQSHENTAAPEASDSANQASAEPTYGIKSEIPSTFSGERGGSAEDAELLALLRGVSSKSSSDSRFMEDGSPATGGSRDTNTKPVEHQQPPSSPLRTQQVLRTESTSESISIAAPRTLNADEDPLSRDDLPAAFKDKSWKIRRKAYDLLSDILLGMVKGRDNACDVDANVIVQGLDDLIPSLVEDTNVNALDGALSFAMLYAEHCSGAGNPEKAVQIITSMFKKVALTSRPTTTNLTFSLVLKLMEVGTEGVSSVHAVVETLLKEGLKSRNPKVALASASLILEAACQFGASTLPLAVITSYSPRILSHSNADVRNTGVKILAEICRALGSKAAIMDVIDGMKKAQVAELDSLLSEQPVGLPARTRLRSQTKSSSTSAVAPEDAIAAMEAGANELEAKRFAARPAVDLMAVLSKTEYSSRIGMAKWSEKVAALTMVLECGGKQPYKLAQPSSSVNYAPLISDMRKLLGDTHFAVCGKSMEVLSMLAEGVGEKLFPHLRPFLMPLVKLSKDKKLTRSVGSCLDNLFGNVLGFAHLLDQQDDALPSVLDEHKEKNALTRTSALEFLARCVQRNDSAGPRGSLTGNLASGVVSLCISKLDDSSASVRSAAMDTFRALLQCSDPEVKKVGSAAVDSLIQSNPRAYKALANVEKAGVQKGAASPVRASRANPRCDPEPAVARGRKTEPPKALNPKRPLPGPERSDSGPTANVPKPTDSAGTGSSMSLEMGLTRSAGLHIPQWDAPEDDGGIFAGLKSSKWMFRQDAIKSITAFVESGQLNGLADIELVSCALLVVVGEHTRGFKETNVNITKAFLQLFLALSECHETVERPIDTWAMKSGVSVSVSKIADRKLSSLCKSLLTEMCIVSHPHAVLLEGLQTIKSVTSPVAHEEYLGWFKSFCKNFGADSIGNGLTDLIPFLLEELAGSNVKVKRAALASIGTLHTHIGPPFKALSLSLAKPILKDQLESCFEEHPFDPSIRTTDWPKRSLAALSALSKNGDKESAGAGVSLSIPRSDLFVELADDCITNLGSKDGKASWKIRKQALDDIEAALKRCNGLLDVSGSRLKRLAELVRALRTRLADTQINLKPSAARIIGVLLSAVDKTTQAKLGSIVYAPLINATMNDIKKPMRDAALGALQAGTTVSPLDGGGLNDEAMEELVTALVAEVNERSSKAGGVPDVLLFVLGVVDSLPNLDDSPQSLGEKYASVIIECLTSSKSETRAAASSLLDASFQKEVVGMESLQKAAGRLKPANQRTVGSQIAKLVRQQAPDSKKSGKENDEPLSVPPTTQQRISHANEPSTTSRRPATAAKTPSIEARESHHKESSQRHPLELCGGSHAPRTQRSVVWPEYPEEPHGSSLLSSLKKSWSPFLPPSTLTALFPGSGIKKQDDALPGLQVLSRALETDRSDGLEVTVAHLDFIFKWLVFVLCSNEATVGLRELLSCIKELLFFMLERKRQFLEAEALVLVPFLLDKASATKGRFQDLFMEVVAMTQREDLLPTKYLGCTVCVAVMERSSHAKARVLGYRISIDCLQKEGLAAVGKKGVMVAAKSLSEETVPENRAASLDLLEVILSKMNGDMQKLERICGIYLSSMAKQLLEERWRKRDVRKEPGGYVDTASRSNLRSQRLPHMTGRIDDSGDTERSPHISNQLPVFSLREGDRGNIDDRFTSSLPGPSIEPNSPNGPAGSAALRARLLKIRERTYGAVEEAESDVNSTQAIGSEELQSAESAYTMGIACLEGISIETSLQEEDSRLLQCIDTLKRFHAALSKQEHPAAGLAVAELFRLRGIIAEHLNETFGCLTRLIRFALDCGDPSINAGMSIPLFSVCLATLMAFFRDPELSPSVSENDLSLLIRETGTALLDPRLAATSELDEATRSQMVRAVNKLAVQAATGASRHVAFHSLVMLQQQLSFESNLTDDDTMNRRLSRVLLKLFARVIKAEEATAEPYSPDTVDMESVICVMEDSLAACREADLKSPAQPHFAVDACTEMVKDLVASILQTYDASSVLAMLEELGIDTELSFLARAIVTIADEGNNAVIVDEIQPSLEEYAIPRVNEDTTFTASSGSYGDTTPHVPSIDVATLVSTLGNAPQGPEREAALVALRNYTSANGDEDLIEHLQQVSSPFRAFIEDQLKTTDTSSVNQRQQRGASSMTERLRILRARLEADPTEVVVPTAVEEKLPFVSSDRSPTGTILSSSGSESRSPLSKLPTPATAKRTSRLTKPSPSKLTTATLRERLAASQESRKNTNTSVASTESTSMAALRARLDAVKQKQIT